VKLVDSGKKYLSQGKYNEAVIELRSAISLNPQLADAHYQLALVYLTVGQLRDASQEIQKTVALQPGNLAAQLKYGNLLLVERKFDEARAAAELILKQEPANVRAQILLASSYVGTFNLNDSIEEVLKPFDLEPRPLPAYLDLASIANLKRDPDKAQTILKKAISDDSGSVLPHLALANLYLQSEQRDEAEQEYKAATSLDAGSHDANRALAFFYVQTQKLDLAERVYAQMASNAQDPAARVVLGQFYAATGKPEQGIQVLEKLLEENPKYVFAGRNLAELYFQRKDYDKANGLADRALKDNANDVDAQLIKARIRLAERKITEAITELQKLVKLRPVAPIGHYFLGLAYTQALDIERAQSEFITAIQNDGTYLQAYLPLAELKLRSADPESAIRFAKQALTLNANLDEAHLLLARAYIAQNNYQSASSEINQFLSRRPGHPSGLYHQGLLNAAQGNFAQAESRFEASFKAYPDQVDSLAALASIALRQNQPDKAIQRVNQAIAQRPAIADFYSLLAQLYINSGDKAKAEDAIGKLVPLDSNLYRRIEVSDLYARSGNLNQSISTLQEVIKADPGNLSARSRLADLHIANKEYDKAVQIADEVLKTDPKQAQALLWKGRVLLAQNKTQDAIAQLQAAVRNEPNSATIRYYLAAAYLQSNDRQKAENELTEAVRTAGAFVMPYATLAQLKLEAGDNESAARYARQAKGVNPSFPEARLILALATKDVAEFKDVSALLKPQVDKNPNDSLLRQRYGTALQGQGDYIGAEAQFDAALKLQPGSIPVVSDLMRVYLAERKPDKAIQRLKELIAQNPPQPALWQLLAEVYATQNDNPHVEEALKKAVEIDPKNVAAKVNLTAFYQRMGESQKSVGIYEQLVQDDPSNLGVKRALAELYVTQGTYDRATKIADDLLKANPKDTSARVIKGRALLRQGKKVEALTELQNGANSDPGSALARYFVGVAYMQNNKLDLAESAWNDALRIDGRLAQADVALAQLKLQMGDLSRAIRYADDALKIDPNQADALLVRGDAQMRNKDFKNAISTFQKLAAAQPKSPVAIQALGNAYAAAGDVAKAEAQLESALQLNPNNTEPLATRASMYVQQRKSERAVQRINKQIEQFPKQAGLYNVLGQVYMADKNYSKADESYRKALSIDASNLDAYNLLGQLYVAQNSIDKAIQEFESALKLNPKSVSAHTVLGMLNDVRNASDKAQLHYREALKLDPQSPIAANNLAWLLAQSGANLDEALGLARTANEKLPNTPSIIDTIGWVYYKKGAYASAIDSFRECLGKAPNQAGCHYHLGLSYSKMGDSRSAKTALEQGLKLNPAAAEATEAKSILATLASR
jgi:tetratricopeptide (TPR) repeat protein